MCGGEDSKDSVAWTLGAKLASGKFAEAVFHEKSPLTAILADLKAEIGSQALESHEIVLKLRDRIEDFLTVGASTPEKHLSLLFSAVGALMVFVQSNWTGPALKDFSESVVRSIASLITFSKPQTETCLMHADISTEPICWHVSVLERMKSDFSLILCF